MAVPTVSWRFEREDLGILPTAFPAGQDPTFSYTTTKYNGDVLAGDAWVVTQISPLTTLATASRDGNLSSLPDTQVVQSSQAFPQAETPKLPTARQNTADRSSITGLPSVMTEGNANHRPLWGYPSSSAPSKLL